MSRGSHTTECCCRRCLQEWVAEEKGYFAAEGLTEDELLHGLAMGSQAGSKDLLAHSIPTTQASEEASPDVLLANSNLVAHGTLGLPLMKRVRN
jgi:hypothetical protein